MEKEEPKQYPIGGYAPGNYYCTCVTCKIMFQGDKRAVQCEPCAIKTTQEEPKQETLEEAAERLIKLNRQDAFYEGAKWQAERMYNEEEVIQLLIKFNQEIQEVEDVKDWFKQFKKK